MSISSLTDDELVSLVELSSVVSDLEKELAKRLSRILQLNDSRNEIIETLVEIRESDKDPDY